MSIQNKIFKIIVNCWPKPITSSEIKSQYIEELPLLIVRKTPLQIIRRSVDQALIRLRRKGLIYLKDGVYQSTNIFVSFSKNKPKEVLSKTNV